MNTEHLQQIIDHYLDRFEDLNGPVHMEYYKWQIAFRFRKMMDEALAAPDEQFSTMLYEVKKLTYNLIDSYTQPFNGLVEFSKPDREPGTVREMFRDLFAVAEGTASEKQKAVQTFLAKSHQLRDKFFPGSYLYNDDLHSVTGYLFLYDPDHNYLYKASHCRAFADCIEFYDDWGYGTDTRLDVFFRMCDQVLLHIKTNEPLMAANDGRYTIDPHGMHPDQEKHILLFDLIYCCTSYGLFKGISYVTPRTGERKLMTERKEKARQLDNARKEAEERLSALNEAKAWLNGALQPGALIHHRIFGQGEILEAEDNTITIQFPGVGQKSFGSVVCAANSLIRFAQEEKQVQLMKYQDILRRGEQIQTAVKQAEKELIPYIEYLD